MGMGGTMFDAGDAKMDRTGRRMEDLLVRCGHGPADGGNSTVLPESSIKEVGKK